MKYHALKLAFLSSVLISLTASAQEKIPPQEVSGRIEWVYDYSAGQELAKKTGKPLMVVFRCER